MVKILFICLGNICRSPMAEFLFKDMVAERGLADKFYIASAATSSYEIGNPVHPAARAINLHSMALVLPVKLPCSLQKQIIINTTTL